MDNFPWLTAMMVVPLVGAALIAALPAAMAERAKELALAFSLATLALGVGALTRFDADAIAAFQLTEVHSWIPSFGVSYALGVDGIALTLILMALILTPVCILAAWHDVPEGGSREKNYFAWTLLLLAFMVGVFAATDVFLFYVFFEAMLIPVYFLIGSYGGPGRQAAAVKFLLFSLAGGLIMLASVIGLYMQGVGVLDKVGTYGMIRFCLQIFPEASQWATPVVIALAVVSIFYGAMAAIAQNDLMRLIAYTSISHFGLIVLGIFAMTTTSGAGATLYMINHGFSTAALFLIAGMLIARRGSTKISDYGGWQRVVPVLAGTFLIGGLSSLALPGLSSFISEFLVITGTFQRYQGVGVLAALSVVLAAIYILWMYKRVMTGPKPQDVEARDLGWREKFVVAPLIASFLVLGVYPKPVLDILNPAVQRVLTEVGVSDPPPVVPAAASTGSEK